MDETDVKKPTPQGLGAVLVMVTAAVGLSAMLNFLLLVWWIRWILCLGFSGLLLALVFTSRKPGV